MADNGHRRADNLSRRTHVYTGMSTLTNRFKHNRLLPLALVFSTLVAGILIGTVISGTADAAKESEEPVTDAAPLVVPSADPVENQFSELARQARPSVVSITVPEVTADETQPRGYLDRPEDFFRRFFGLPNQPNQRPPAPPRRRGEGQGSGVIVDPKGYIITNEHVVRDAERIRVEFVGDGERYDAKLIGVDPETDLAVIHVDGKENLQAARIGNSDAANIGDWAIAIGSPFGYKETVTVGIISAKPREIGAEFQKFLQTDAAINPGNSGGPLLNIRGEVIGINTAIISRTGGYDGIGFALASNIAVETYNQIIRYGRVSRGSIGVQFESDNESRIRSWGAEHGVFVTKVVPAGPAQDAGMQAEDIIVSVDGIKIDSGEKLIEVVAATSVGKTVPVEVFRSGKNVTLQVKIADRETLFSENAEVRIDAEEEDEQAVHFGITVREMSPDGRAEMNLEMSGGILVANVEANSFADDIGVVAGDVIVAVNRMEISSIKELRDIQKQLRPGQDVSFKVLRWVGQEWNTRYPAGVVPE